MTEWSDETVTVDGHNLHYFAAGDERDPTVLLLHGGIIDAARISWGEVIGPLATDHHVIALDLLGYGESDKPDGDYSLDRHVRLVAAFLETSDLAPVTVVGLSMGGGVAIGLALDHSGLVDRLVAIDSYGLGTDLPNGLLSWALARVQVFNRVAIALFRRSRGFTKASLGNIAHDADALSESAVDAVWAETKRPGAGTGFRGFRAAEVARDGYRTEFTDRLEELSVPTRLLHGEHDEVFPVDWSRRAADRIPDAELFVLEDCAHWAPRERPARVVELVSDFVADS